MGMGVGKLLFNGCRISVGDDEKVLEIDSSDSCPTLLLYLIPLKYPPKNI